MTALCRLAACLSLGFVAACAESSVVPPTAPSPLNPEKVGELGIVCPASRPVQSMDGNPVLLDYPPPEVAGGQPPITTACEPASGTRFAVGPTRVSCTAADALGQRAACAFVQRVLPPPMLGVTRIVAFGDSLTAGVVSAYGGSVPERDSYPAQLRQRLRSAYRTQAIDVFNEGVPGERAVHAPGRLASVLDLHRPEVVLLMEGTNDLSFSRGVGGAALEALARMVGMVQAAGAAPVLATIPPIRADSEHGAAIAGFNSELRAVAAASGAGLVDVHEVIARGRCPTGGARRLPCLGPDGLHPSVEGYALIAGAFFEHLVRTYDQPVAAPADRPASIGAPPAGPLPAGGGEGGRSNAE